MLSFIYLMKLRFLHMFTQEKAWHSWCGMGQDFCKTCIWKSFTLKKTISLITWTENSNTAMNLSLIYFEMFSCDPFKDFFYILLDFLVALQKNHRCAMNFENIKCSYRKSNIIYYLWHCSMTKLLFWAIMSITHSSGHVVFDVLWLSIFLNMIFSSLFW